MAGAAKANGSGEAIDYGPLADWVGFNLRMAQAAAFQAFRGASAKEIGTRPGRFATLMLIGRNPGISQTALSRANGRDKSSLTPVLNDLARRGLVIRRRDPAPTRAHLRLSLTPAGRRLLAELTRCARASTSASSTRSSESATASVSCPSCGRLKRSSRASAPTAAPHRATERLAVARHPVGR